MVIDVQSHLYLGLPVGLVPSTAFCSAICTGCVLLSFHKSLLVGFCAIVINEKRRNQTLWTALFLLIAANADGAEADPMMVIISATPQYGNLYPFTTPVGVAGDYRFVTPF